MAQNASLATQQASAPTISRRAYNALTFGIVTLCFLVTFGEYTFFSAGNLMLGGGGLLSLIISLVGTFGGIILMGAGKSKQSVAMSAIGLAIFTLTFGATVALALTQYPIGSINYAFSITACLSAIFLILGVLFPNFFSRIGGVLFAGLIGVLLIEMISTFFFHIQQGWLDYLVVLLFCGFLGYDAYLMSNDAPTVPNAIFYASDIFVDVVNILLRVLRIMDRD